MIESQPEALINGHVDRDLSVRCVVRDWAHPIHISGIKELLDLAFAGVFSGLFEGLLDLREVKPVV